MATAEENRLAHFRAKVEELSGRTKDGSLRLREGYRAVADDTGLTYDYVYQVYAGKSGKKALGADAVRKFSAAYGEGRPAGWMDLPPQPTDSADESDFEPLGPSTLEGAIATIATTLANLDEIGREYAANLLATLAKNPDQADKTMQMLETLVKVHSSPDQPDPPPRPRKVKAPNAASAARPRNKATLVLKIGGGQKQQFDLPLHRSAFRSESAPANEREWYDRVRAAPKASDED